jgi:isoleucyl-tRNA synthetase
MLEIDRFAMGRAANMQADILAHFDRYEFHPVVAKLQIYCSEDLGGFYLDVLKDRLYTSAPKSLARRSAQTALWHINQAMLRWMAPFLSFTAEEAWAILSPEQGSIFVQTYCELPKADDALQAKWARIRDIREVANKAIEERRAAGDVGSSLQAELGIGAAEADLALLQSLNDDLRFVFITSKVTLEAADSLRVAVQASADPKCERCWHYVADVGAHAQHATLCGRCVANIA